MRVRNNPFRTEQLLKVQYRPQQMSWPELLQRCEALRYRGALVGPFGSGKTTLLEALEARLQERGFLTSLVRFNLEQQKFKRGLLDNVVLTLTSRTIVLFDGVEQLNPLAWHWFKWRTRRGGGLIVTTHEAGRLPTLCECRTSAHLLAEIAAELLGCDAQSVLDKAESAFIRHSGNLRDALREWYDAMTYAI
jgi:hypothetical protein